MDKNTKIWLSEVFGNKSFNVTPLRNDASFRCYFRVHNLKQSYVLMVAPPAKENCQRFIDITKRLTLANVRVPAIYADNVAEGYLLLEDFGDVLLLDALHNNINDSTHIDTLYQSTIDTLIDIQIASHDQLETFDSKMQMEEMQMFVDWYCIKHLGIEFSQEQEQILKQFFLTLIESATNQPQVFVHRDYHSRNLMVLDANGKQGIGIIDYQDAVYGPVTYDLVSLLKDCYITWPDHKVASLIDYYLASFAAKRVAEMPHKIFIQWFNWMGIQRHLKAVGTFARLHHRDGKDAYLDSIPPTLKYIRRMLKQYAVFSDVEKIFHEHLPTQSL